jgi:hypothetical protein
MDGKRATAFTTRVAGLLDHALLGLMISVGHRTGLFTALAGLKAATSAQLAAACDLEERYVREWLAAMVAGRIVDHDGARGTYALPPEHADSLVGGGENLAARAAAVARVAAAEDEIVAAFRRGDSGWRGVAWGEGEGVPSDEIIARVPGLRDRLLAGVEVADLTGEWISLGPSFPASRFVAVSPAQLSGEARFDLILARDLHEQPRPDELVRRVFAALRAGGQFICRELAAASNLADNVDRPRAAALYSLSLCCSLPKGLAGSGAGLGMLWGLERALELFARAGFPHTTVERAAKEPLHHHLIATRPGGGAIV